MLVGKTASNIIAIRKNDGNFVFSKCAGSRLTIEAINEIRRRRHRLKFSFIAEEGEDYDPVGATIQFAAQLCVKFVKCGLVAL